MRATVWVGVSARELQNICARSLVGNISIPTPKKVKFTFAANAEIAEVGFDAGNFTDLATYRDLATVPRIYGRTVTNRSGTSKG